MYYYYVYYEFLWNRRYYVLGVKTNELNNIERVALLPEELLTELFYQLPNYEHNEAKIFAKSHINCEQKFMRLHRGFNYRVIILNLVYELTVAFISGGIFRLSLSILGLLDSAEETRGI